MWKKLAAMVSASLTVASCQTSLYKPIVCDPGTALRDGRCQKVPQSLKNATRAPALLSIPDKPKRVTAPRMDAYGQPL